MQFRKHSADSEFIRKRHINDDIAIPIRAVRLSILCHFTTNFTTDFIELRFVWDIP